MRVSIFTSSSLIFLSAFAPLGCADFDRQDRLEDTRIIAIRTEPAEIKFSPLYSLLPVDQRPPGFALPSVGEVEVEAFAFDPRGGDFATTMQFCPDNAGDSSCLEDFDPTPRYENLEGAARESVQSLYEIRTRQPQVTASDLISGPSGQVPDANYTFNFDTAAMDEVIRARFSIFSLTPRFVFNVENTKIITADGASKERAFKRIPFAIDFGDPTFPPDILEGVLDAIGTKLCDGGLDGDDFAEGTVDCLAATPPNENPNLIGFNLFGDPQEFGVKFGETADLGKTAFLSASRGDEITLEPVFSPGAVERYQVFSFEIESNNLIVINRFEDLALSWYTTDGDISSALGSVQFGEALDATWTLPGADARDAGDLVTLVLVVRDQRGGVDFARIKVELR